MINVDKWRLAVTLRKRLPTYCHQHVVRLKAYAYMEEAFSSSRHIHKRGNYHRFQIQLDTRQKNSLPKTGGWKCPILSRIFWRYMKQSLVVLCNDQQTSWAYL